MKIENYFEQIGKMLEIVFPAHHVELTLDGIDYVYWVYKGNTDDERYENYTYKFILKDMTEHVRANIVKRRTETQTS